MQVPCISMFLKIQNQVSKHMCTVQYISNWTHHPKPETIHSLCSDSKYLSHHQLFSLPSFPIYSVSKSYSYYLFHILYFFFCFSILWTLFLFMFSLPATVSISTISYCGRTVFHTDKRTILLILFNLIIFLLKKPLMTNHVTKNEIFIALCYMIPSYFIIHTPYVNVHL